MKSKLNKNTIPKVVRSYNDKFTSKKGVKLRNQINKILFLFAFVSTLFFASNEAEAQTQKRKVTQISGIILGEDSISGLPGVHVFVPKRQDGTTSNYLGFFSMPVLVGDSVVFSAIGYENASYIVPDNNGKQLTLVVELVSDTTFLDEVVVLPFPTEELFKEAILALNIPEDQDIDENNLNQELLTLMMRSAPMDAQMNYRNYMDQMIYNQTYRYGLRPNPFLNPFNWAKFIKSLKNRNK